MSAGLYNRVRHGIRYFLLRRLPTCRELAPVMSASLERRLTLRERVLLRTHIVTCVWCDWYLDHLHVLRRSSREQGEEARAEELSSSARLSDQARERIRRALSNGQPPDAGDDR